MKTKTKGAFVQCSDGTWMIDTKVKVDDTFKHFKRTGYPTLSAAKADFETEKAKFIQSKKISKTEIILFEDLLEEYKKMRKIIVNVSTYSNCDESIYNVYFLPYFSGKLLKDCINKTFINNWYHSLVDTPKYSNNKKSKVITRMKDLLKFSYMHKYIDADTYQDCDVCLYQVKYSKTPMNERVIWSENEEKAFWDTVKVNERDYLMFRVFFSCSPRIGEFLGLQPNCFDYAKRKIIIKQQVQNIVGEGIVLTDKLKSHESYRSILLTQEMADMLQDYITTLGIKSNEYIFFGDTKSLPMARTTFRRKLYMYCSNAGVRKINPHATRHLQAVKLCRVAKNGEEIEAAAHRLGHTPEMFMNTYAKHTNDDTENKLIERMCDA